MPVTPEDVSTMASLARLDVDAATHERFTRQFGDILDYMDVLNHIDTTGVAPMYGPGQELACTREDAARSLRPREAVLRGAPEQDGQYFMVPRIV